MVHTPKSLKVISSDQVDPGVLLTSDIASAEFNVANKLVKLDGSADVPLAQIPDTLTGKDADTLDTKHYSDIASEIDGDITTHAALNDVTGVHTIGSKYELSDDILHSNDSEVAIPTTSYSLLKTLTIDDLYPTPTNVRFVWTAEYNSEHGSNGTILYKGGAQLSGTAHSASGTFEHDVSVAEGDVITLRGRQYVSWGKVSNYRVHGKSELATIGANAAPGFAGTN